MFCKVKSVLQKSCSVPRRTSHIYTYIAVSREKDFSIALKECLDELCTNFSKTPTIAFMFSSHKTIQESMYKRLYKNNQWLKVGCLVPKISDDQDVRMCISGFLAEGSNNAITVSSDVNNDTLKTIYDSTSPCILFKPFQSAIYPEVGRFKCPAGLITSRNTSLLHNPNALDTLLCEGKEVQSAVCIQFKKSVFEEQTFDSVLKPTLSLLTPYLCNFNLAFWNSIFPPLQPQMIEVSPTAHYNSLPLLRGLALIFPLASSTLYLYQPSHLYMLRKHLRSPFIVTPPIQEGESPHEEVGTVCRVEEVVSVGDDGAVLCRVRGDQRVRVLRTHRIVEEMGSIVGDVEVLQDKEDDSSNDESSASWKTMATLRELLLRRYEGKENQFKEITNRYGTMPYNPTLFSFWLCSFLTASGKDKEQWFRLRSTEERLQILLSFMKHKCSLY